MREAQDMRSLGEAYVQLWHVANDCSQRAKFCCKIAIKIVPIAANIIRTVNPSISL
jgi:hypothetical protein